MRAHEILLLRRSGRAQAPGSGRCHGLQFANMDPARRRATRRFPATRCTPQISAKCENGVCFAQSDDAAEFALSCDADRVADADHDDGRTRQSSLGTPRSRRASRRTWCRVRRTLCIVGTP
jgi:hypothetical protein